MASGPFTLPISIIILKGRTETFEESYRVEIFFEGGGGRVTLHKYGYSVFSIVIVLRIPPRRPAATQFVRCKRSRGMQPQKNSSQWGKFGT